MKIILIAAGLSFFLIAVVIILAAFQPGEIVVQRSRVIHAAPTVVFSLVNDFQNWPKWAPQDREDSTLKRTNGTPSAGVGAVSDWAGSGPSGTGRMEIIKSIPDREVDVQVDFRRPFVAHNLNAFRLSPTEDGTRVTWSMRGTNVFLMRVMSVFTSADKLVGKHFETGLANLAAAAENSP